MQPRLELLLLRQLFIQLGGEPGRVQYILNTKKKFSHAVLTDCWSFFVFSLLVFFPLALFLLVVTRLFCVPQFSFNLLFLLFFCAFSLSLHMPRTFSSALCLWLKRERMGRASRSSECKSSKRKSAHSKSYWIGGKHVVSKKLDDHRRWYFYSCERHILRLFFRSFADLSCVEWLANVLKGEF